MTRKRKTPRTAPTAPRTSRPAQRSEKAADAGKGRIDLVLIGLCVLALAVRLIGVNTPFFDLQAWRQAETAAVARNYYEEGLSFFYPRVDWRGDTPGYVEMEFPLYQFLVACLYRLVGAPREWIGHAVSAMFSVATIPPLYALARKLYGVRAARFAAIAFVVAPLNVFYGRAFMPDAAMLFFSVGAVYLFACWTAGERPSTFAAAVTFAALAFLVKLPTLYLGLPLLFLAYNRFGKGLFRQPALWAFAALTLAPMLLWYGHAYRLFQQTHLTYGIWNRYGYAKWGNLDLLASGQFYVLMLQRLIGVTFTPLGFVVLVAGILMKVRSQRERVVHVWLLALILYLLIVPEGNRELNYYQLPFVPVGALFMGKALGRFCGDPAPGRAVPGSLRARRIALAVVLIGMVGLSYTYARPLFAAQPYYVAQYEIGRDVDGLIPKDALLVVGDLDDNSAPYRTQAPTLLYFCHRKGWQLLPEEFRDRDRLATLAQRGARFFLVPVKLIYQLDRAYVSMVLQDAAGTEIRRFEKY